MKSLACVCRLASALVAGVLSAPLPAADVQIEKNIAYLGGDRKE